MSKAYFPSLAAAAMLAAFAGGQANAQQAAAPAFTGPVIPGMCVLDNERLIATSAVGKAVSARLQQLEKQVEAELTPQRTALQNEANALRTAKAQPNDPRVATLNQKAQAYERTAQIRQREMQMTQQKALLRIGTEAEPVMRQVATQQKCGMIVARGAVLAASTQMDITDEALAALNAKITTFNFERERLPEQQAAAPAARN